MPLESPSSKIHKKKLTTTPYSAKVAAILGIMGTLSGVMAKPPTTEEKLTRAQQYVQKQDEKITTLTAEKDAAESKLQLETAINQRLVEGLGTLPAEFQKHIGYTPDKTLDDETKKQILKNMMDELKDKKIISQEEYDDLWWRSLKNPSLIPFIILAIIAALSFGALGAVAGLVGGYAGVKAAILKIKSELVGWGKKAAKDWGGNRKNNNTTPPRGGGQQNPPPPRGGGQQNPPPPRGGGQQNPPPPRGGDRQRENQPRKSPEDILHERWSKLIHENKTTVNWKMTQEEAKKLFRRMSVKTHPDKFPEKKQEAEVIFKILNDMQPNNLPGTRGRKDYDISGLQRLEATLKSEGWIV